MRKKQATQTITIKSNEENPAPYELIAESIIKISDAFDQINKSKLDKRVIELLIKDQFPEMKMIDIRNVLYIAPKLKDIYIKK